MNELLVIIAVLSNALKVATGVAAQASAEGRDPTPEEIASVRKEREAVEAEFDQRFPAE
jgi:hypothetical protein